jgi:hypothetical protein
MNDRVSLLLPEKLGLSSNGHSVTVTVTNLIMTLWYKKADFEIKSRSKAEKTLKTKRPAIDYAIIRYLLALLDADVIEVGIQLELYC